MTEQTNNADGSMHKNTSHHSFVEKIVEKITGKHHDHSGEHTAKHHQYGGAENEHDNAYVAEAGIVGAHAIPPMTTHACPKHHPQEHRKQKARDQKPDTPANPPVSFQDHSDCLVGDALYSAERGHQPTM
ncbi:hypothetical protein BGX31_009403 [Mortierella sp. GBA43]|nr:hypothetical protein BGX31_009403 [Mortierella sp. GBA43]